MEDGCTYSARGWSHCSSSAVEAQCSLLQKIKVKNDAQPGLSEAIKRVLKGKSACRNVRGRNCPGQV